MKLRYRVLTKPIISFQLDEHLDRVVIATLMELTDHICSHAGI
jgi:hypothetical protein